MRLNVYNEEITGEVVVIKKKADTGKIFWGLRFMLESSDKLHHDADDDDRSSVTFWVDDPAKLFSLLEAADDAVEGVV